MSAEGKIVTYVLDAVVRPLDVPPLDFQDDPAMIKNRYCVNHSTNPDLLFSSIDLLHGDTAMYIISHLRRTAMSPARPPKKRNLGSRTSTGQSSLWRKPTTIMAACTGNVR